MKIYVYAIGTNADKISDYCNQFNIRVKNCLFLNIAVNQIDKYHTQNSVAILSPAAASLDQFKSYAHRGNEFKKLVIDLS